MHISIYTHTHIYIYTYSVYTYLASTFPIHITITLLYLHCNRFQDGILRSRHYHNNRNIFFRTFIFNLFHRIGDKYIYTVYRDASIYKYIYRVSCIIYSILTVLNNGHVHVFMIFMFSHPTHTTYYTRYTLPLPRLFEYPQQPLLLTPFRWDVIKVPRY
jgi:hypothetical protein